MAKRKILPSQAYLQECFDYNPETGVLRWKERPLSHFNTAKYPLREHARWNARYAENEAGGLITHSWKTKSYTGRVVSLDRIDYICARIIYKLLYNEEHHQIDHRDIEPLNNKSDNLRPCTVPQNCANQTIRSNNTTGFKGVYFRKDNQKYGAQIGYKRKHIHLGFYDTPEEAHLAYMRSALELFGEFARTE